MSEEKKVLVVANYDELSRVAAEKFVFHANTMVQRKGIFTVALSGGFTPKGLYMRLASDPYREQIPWSKVHLFWGDERCVPPDHRDSNYHTACELLLKKVAIPEENIHRIHAEQEDQNRAAAEYEQMLRIFFRLGAEGYPCFDLILLGMGEDGHIASLFPGTPALEETRRLVVASYREKLGEYRLTLTVPVLNHATNVIFLISGESKATILKKVLEGKRHPQCLPSQLIQLVNGRLLFIVDSMAARELKCYAERQG